MGIGTDKQKQWQLIKDNAPELAEVLINVGKEFGKLQLSVEFESGDSFKTDGFIDEGDQPQVWVGNLKRIGTGYY